MSVSHAGSLMRTAWFTISGLIALALSLLNIGGWITGEPWMLSLGKGLPTMAASTVILFFFILVPYFLLLRKKNWSNIRLVILTTSSVVFLINIPLFILSFTDFQPSFPSISFVEPGMNQDVPFGHMSPFTCGLFSLLSLDILLLAFSPGKGASRILSSILTASITLISGFMTITYLLGWTVQENLNIFPMALNTSLSFLFLSIGLGIFIITPALHTDHTAVPASEATYVLPITISLLTVFMMVFIYLNIQTVFRNLHTETRNRLSLISDLKANELKNMNPGESSPFVVTGTLGWPVDSQPGLISLVGYQGDSILVYQKNGQVDSTSLEIRVNPIIFPGSALSRALQGESGMISSTEQNGESWISSISRIPGTGWSVICSVTEKQVNQPVAYQLFQITALILGLMSLGISLLVLVSRQLKIRSYREQIEATQVLQEQLIKSRDEAQLSNRLKDAFIANISHEIRTPLNAIMGFTELLESDLAESDVHEYDKYFEIIRSSSERLTRTVELILNVSRLEVGAYTPHIEEFRLDEEIEKLVGYYRLQAEKKGLILDFFNSSLETVVKTDKYCVVSAVSNLIENAVKYTYKGEIRVHLYHTGQNRICLDVSDTGIGISQEFLARLFEPFSQEETGYSRSFEGVGLGLSIAQRLLKNINATISVESQKGAGTTFRITF